jgi:hypothetical protein
MKPIAFFWEIDILLFIATFCFDSEVLFLHEMIKRKEKLYNYILFMKKIILFVLIERKRKFSSVWIQKKNFSRLR